MCIEKQDNVQVSIIMAIYNVDAWLNRALQSVLSQSYSHIEVILVDDGSTDKSGLICDDMAKKDSRIKVIHKTNGGVSSARQVGLETAKGDYVIYCDPDDFMELDMIEHLVTTAKNSNADIVTCDYFRNEEIVNFVYDNGSDLLEKYVKNQLFPFCWNCLVKNSFIRRNQLQYTPLWLNHSEDGLFVARVLAKQATTAHVARPLYHYILREGSLTHSFSDKSYNSIIAVVKELQNIQQDKSEDLLYSRMKYVKQVAFETHRFSDVRNLFPEINIRISGGG